jgi:RNA recognition motif-containing protein
MAYDYDGLVSEIAASRKLAREAEAELKAMADDADETARSSKELDLLKHLSISVDTFEVLSKHCPMTPLLWMQYSLDTYELMKVIKKQDDPEIFSRPDSYVHLREIVEMRIQLLELGLHEFPGSAILRLHHAELVFASGKMQSQSQSPEQQGLGKEEQEKYKKMLDDAIEAVGHGAHRNESRLVVELYKLRCDYEQQCVTEDEATTAIVADGLSRLFLQRAETPMNDGINAGLGEQYVTYCGGNNNKWTKATTVSEIESRRRLEAKHYGFLVTYEDDIDVALKHESGVSNRDDGIERWMAATAEAQEVAGNDSDFYDILRKWKAIIDVDNNGSWMGLGGPQTANAFVQYAQTCFRYRSRKRNFDDDDEKNAKALEEKIQNLAVSVFERGVAECPTIESLWLSYLRRLNYLIVGKEEDAVDQQRQQQRQELLTKASSVVDRAIRNCPYSIELVKAKLKLVLAMANAKMLYLDPEELLTKLIVKETLENGFIIQLEGESNNPSTAIELFRSLLDVVRHRILFVLAETAQTKVTAKKNVGKGTVTTILNYDDPESIQHILSSQKQAPTTGEMGEEVLQELEDLCNDLREIYDEADSYMRKNHKKYRSDDDHTIVTVEEGRAALAKDRAVTESHLVAPLLHAIQIANDNGNFVTEGGATRMQGRARLAEVLQQHDRATKIWQPPHPGTYTSYIGALSASSSVTSSMLSSPKDVLTNLRMVRFLYQKALKGVGKPQKKSQSTPAKADPTTVSNNSAAMVLSPDELDYEMSLRCLCRDYLIFEKHFGSDRSYSECQKSVQKKLAKAYAMATDTDTDNTFNTTTRPVVNYTADVAVPMALEAENDNTSTEKRKREDDNGASDEIENETKASDQPVPPPIKRQKEEPKNEPSSAEPKEVPPRKPTNFQEIEELKGRKQFPKHKVKVGKLEYPSHPFTVKVSFLSPQTEDIDLVEALRPRCGQIVHAKIMRDKHTSRSKGWALVQFEERESVETALGLSDVIGIKAKSVIIERSHLPAIGLVPTGMHKVNPKGEGRSTKRNQHLLSKKQTTNEPEGGSDRKHQSKNYPQPADGDGDSEAKGSDSKPATPKPSASTTSIFAFRPRGMTKGVGASQKRKAKISFSSSEAKK